LANSNQGLRERALWWILGLALLTVFFEQIYSGPDLQWWWIFFALAAGVAAWQVHSWIGKRRLEECYLDYRALAEASRVQFYWQMAGIEECAADHYLRDQRDELEWIRHALRSLSLPTLEPARANDPAGCLHSVRLNWLEGQRDYFVAQSTRQSVFYARGERWAALFFYGGLSSVVAALAFHIAGMPLFPAAGERVLLWIIVGYGMFFGLAAVTEANLWVRAYREQSHRYRKMGLYYTLAARQMAESMATGDSAGARKVLVEIGKLALVENGDWLILHRQRPVEVPIG
jgi:hypothetical protein